MRSLLSVIVLIATLPPGSSSAQESCDLKGVWQLASGTYGGEAAPPSWRQIKIITATHFVFVGEGDRGVKGLMSAADSLAAYRTMFYGGGTYTLRGTTYTEKAEYFADPAYLGSSFAFQCRTEGDRFIMTGNFPIMEGGKKVRDIKLEEEWRRIERF